MSNKVENSETTDKEANCSVSVKNEIFETIFKTGDCTSQTKKNTESDDYASSTDGSVDADHCSLSTKNITEDNDHVKKMMVVDDEFSETTYSVKKEVLEIDNYSNYQTVKKQDIEQAPIQIIDTLENFNIKKETNEEFIIKDEKSDINDGIFECDSCELNFTTAKQLDSHTILCRKKNKKDGVDYLNKNVKEEVLETDNYENYSTVIEQDPLKIEDTLEEFEIKKDINKEIIKDGKSDTNEAINNKKKLYSRKNPQCNVCNKSFESRSILITHKLNHMNDEPIVCDVCNKVYNNQYSLKRHKRKHTGEKPYECDVCKKRFGATDVLRLHKRIHTGEKPYECDTCKKKFSDKSDLNVHKRIHTGEKPYECDVCKISFRLKHRLISHKLIHTGEKPYECDVCKKSFRQKCTLKQHKLIHTGEKPHECDTCKKSFSEKSDLNVHKRVHTGEKPYECDVCKISFRQRTNLITHKLIHTGEKPHECEVCKKSFRIKHVLKQHKLMHTGEKPFTCEICNKSFRYRSHINSHRRVHNAETP